VREDGSILRVTAGNTRDGEVLPKPRGSGGRIVSLQEPLGQIKDKI
jgi:hypothetical protein